MKEDSLNRKQPCYDFSQHNGSARRHTLQDASAITSSAPHLLGQESSDTRSECGDAVARLRRSPSYTSAIGDDVCGDDQKLSQKSRYHDGKIYVGVKCTSDKDSILWQLHATFIFTRSCEHSNQGIPWSKLVWEATDGTDSEIQRKKNV